MGNVLDNLFSAGGFFGGAPGDTEAQKAQGMLLLRMMIREGKLYPELEKILQESTGNADLAYGAATTDVNALYPGVKSDISTFNMPPAALDALNKIRENRLSSLDPLTTKLIGSEVGSLARSGMTSSSRAEGMGERVASQVAPQIGQIESDYQNALTTMPGDIASKKYALAAGQAGLTSEALRSKYKDLLDPYLAMWKTSAGVGATTPSVNNDPGSGASNAMNIAKIAAMFA